MRVWRVLPPRECEQCGLSLVLFSEENLETSLCRATQKGHHELRSILGSFRLPLLVIYAQLCGGPAQQQFRALECFLLLLPFMVTMLGCLTVCLPACLSYCLSVCLSVCYTVCLLVSLPVCLSGFLFVSLTLSVYLPVCLSLIPSVCLSVFNCLYVSLSLCLPLCLTVSCTVCCLAVAS